MTLRRGLLAISYALLIAGFICIAHAQLPQTGVGKPAAAYVGPGDVVSSALAFVGFRAYSAAKAGTKAANICNASDVACADINSLANGKFDLTTAQGAPLNCGGSGGTCTVKTLYDQTGALSCGGSACDLVQATIASRPTLVLSCQNSLPCMQVASTTQTMVSAGSVTQAQPFSYSAVARRTVVGGALGIIFDAGTPDLIFRTAANNVGIVAGGSRLGASATDNAFHSLQSVYNDANTLSNLFVEGTGSGPVNTIGTTGMNGVLEIGGGGGTDTFNFNEAGAWAISFSGTNVSGLTANQRAYWNF